MTHKAVHNVVGQKRQSTKVEKRATKRKRSRLTRVLLDVVAPLALYEGEVSRVEVPDTAPVVEIACAQARELKLLRAVGQLNRRGRRAFRVLTRGGHSSRVALHVARAR